MRGSSSFLLMALGLAITGATLGCGEAFSSTCEGDECADGLDAGSGGEDGSRSDGGGAGDAGGDAGDSGASCPAQSRPADRPCVIDEEYGVFVAPGGDDDGGDGSRGAPYGSIGRGLVDAKAFAKNLYVCDDGTGYTEAVAVDASFDGRAVYGGFSCGDWSYGAVKAKIKPSGPGVVWRFDGIPSGFRLEDFVLVARDAEAAGESSIAVLVNASREVVLRGVDIVAGRGGEGEAGVPETSPAPKGNDGKAGDNACHANPNPGAASVATMCGAKATSGGRGGDGGVALNTAGNGNPGLPSSGGKGAEGSGQGSKACTPGGEGADGGDGDAGSGGTGIGVLDENGWRGASGSPGGSGASGQGGGGGGGAKAPLSCGLVEPTGASGGSGGGGGCGGLGGAGGKAGGSSVALVSIDSRLQTSDCRFISSDGGDGGAGAEGQAGGVGGSGAVGGSGTASSSAACTGGNGGRGGDGGPGGGGAGGHSLGIAYRGERPSQLDNEIALGGAGRGGDPGGSVGHKGADGQDAEELEF